MNSASAGPLDASSRSDCAVRVWETSSGEAAARTINSKVLRLYGTALRAEIEASLAALGASDLSLALDDQGALPFTLRARIETAVCRLRPETRRTIAHAANGPNTSSRRRSLRRTRLYLPGNTPKLFINAGLYGADAIILDLEDAVAPAEKDAARILVGHALAAVDFGPSERMVRVNVGAAGLAEIEALAPLGVDVFVLPKVETPAAVAAAHDAVLRAGGQAGLLVTLESARGVMAAAEIAAAPGVVAMTLGLEDYTADLGATRTADGVESAWARGQVLNAARAAGIQPLGSVYPAIDDDAGFARWVRRERDLGHEGVACLHPRQVALAHAALAPGDAEVAAAERVIAAAARAAGGVTSVDGRMVDAPVVARARRVLASKEPG